MLNTPYGTRGLARGKNFLPHNLHQKPGIPPQDRISCSALKKRGGGREGSNLPFCWEQVDSLSDLNRLCLVLDALPDTDIINALRETRANGRNEYPAAAYGLRCEGWKKCHDDAGCETSGYGRVVRVPLERDRRIFTPTPRSSVSWHRAYRRRNAIERINFRIDNSFGFERRFIRGKAKMTVRAGLALTVMMALAVGHIKAGRPECMRSLVSGYWADTG